MLGGGTSSVIGQNQSFREETIATETKQKLFRFKSPVKIETFKFIILSTKKTTSWTYSICCHANYSYPMRTETYIYYHRELELKYSDLCNGQIFALISARKNSVFYYRPSTVSDGTGITHFYNDLSSFVLHIPNHKVPITAGDLNVQIRKNGYKRFCLKKLPKSNGKCLAECSPKNRFVCLNFKFQKTKD